MDRSACTGQLNLLQSSAAYFLKAFFALRLWTLTGNRVVPVICWFLIILEFGASILASAQAFKMLSLTTYNADWAWLLTGILLEGALIDLLIAGTLCIDLWIRRNQVFQSCVIHNLIAM